VYPQGPEQFDGDKPTGSFGKLACFNMNPMKNLSGCGEAGMVLVNDAELAESLQSLRYAETITKEKFVHPS
jgi:dTDP-4-amino-4,6-dideoxygalactose transaminase